MRAIDADSLINLVRDSTILGSGFKQAFVATVNGEPTIEPTIIRCKDCKWFGDIGCAISIVDNTDKPSEEDYCSFAERRTDGRD